MPRRSNWFQRVVYMIERQCAPTGAKVTESKLMVDAVTGAHREVDVVIELDAGARDIRICVECIDHKRPADVTWIEKMRAKHLNLPTDRLVLVSREGFTTPALAKSRFYNIDAMSPEEAPNVNWMKLNDPLSLKVYGGLILRVTSAKPLWIDSMPDHELRIIEQSTVRIEIANMVIVQPYQEHLEWILFMSVKWLNRLLESAHKEIALEFQRSESIIKPGSSITATVELIVTNARGDVNEIEFRVVGWPEKVFRSRGFELTVTCARDERELRIATTPIKYGNRVFGIGSINDQHPVLRIHDSVTKKHIIILPTLPISEAMQQLRGDSDSDR